MTDTITLPRSVVGQALEALKYEREANNPLDWHHDKTMTALRAALEQPLPVFEDPAVQTVYEILCDTECIGKPRDEHWEGWQARRIVAALEQPDTNTVSEPVAWRCFDGEGDFEYCSEEPSEETRAWSARYNREWEPLYIHPQPRQQQAEQGPVASIYIADNGEREFDDWRHELPVGRNYLYTHPQNLNCKSTQHRLATLWGYEKSQPPRQPLTDEQITDLWIKHACSGAYIHAFAQAVERAHGIGGEK